MKKMMIAAVIAGTLLTASMANAQKPVKNANAGTASEQKMQTNTAEKEHSKKETETTTKETKTKVMGDKTKTTHKMKHVKSKTVTSTDVKDTQK